jgi:hypothetical protein
MQEEAKHVMMLDDVRAQDDDGTWDYCTFSPFSPLPPLTFSFSFSFPLFVWFVLSSNSIN